MAVVQPIPEKFSQAQRNSIAHFEKRAELMADERDLESGEIPQSFSVDWNEMIKTAKTTYD